MSAGNSGNNRILEIAPSDELSDGFFRQFPQSAGNQSPKNVVQLDAHGLKGAVGRPPGRSGSTPTIN
jgi:hypothetical protein